MRINSSILLAAIYVIVISCEFNDQKTELKENDTLSKIKEETDSLIIRRSMGTSPVLTPYQSIRSMEVEKGMEVKLVAAEPLVTAPIALTFDFKGRIWVVEMTGYMPNTEGNGEDIPNGKIVILEDLNGDGIVDERKVFLDSLVLPRAIGLVDNGILVAEPPNLWFYEINKDVAGEKTLVDSEYAVDGNVEHQPNGLLRAMDNWIYNAKSDKRYKKKGNKWKIEQTHFRGQWGITQDNYGRLYYNNNGTNLIGDYFSPGLGANNKNQPGVVGFRERLIPDNRVYPARPTPGVNRGYMENILDDSLRLVNFTAACGPVIYRGNLFGEEFEFNSFVAETAGNLIKRNKMKKEGNITNGSQAYEGKEFIASTDERFRPVNLYNGPDGALYIIDMYRGIIQHKTYLTPYLKKEIESRDLTLPLSYGRIYKVVPVDKPTENNIIPENSTQLVQLLGHSNGWTRDMAQRKLLDWNCIEAIPDLQKALNEKNNPLKVIHAMWSLEGLEALNTETVLALLQNKDWPIRMQALNVLPSVMKKNNYFSYLPILEQMVKQKDSLSAPYVAFIAGSIQDFDEVVADDLIKKVVKAFPDDVFVADAALSSLEGKEEIFWNGLVAESPNVPFVMEHRFERVLQNIKDMQKEREQELLKKEFPKGSALFSRLCQTCHGEDGNGIESLAPPLNNSEWVTGNKRRLAAIVLYGMSGPVEVNGHLYEPPEITGEMPGIGFDQSITNEDVAQLLSYIRKNWENSTDEVNAKEVEETRQRFKDKVGSFTVKELDEIFE